MNKTEWIFNPELTEGDREKVYDNEDSNPDYWEWCQYTEKAFKEEDAEALIDHYGAGGGYIDWLKEWRIIIPKPTEAAKSYSYTEKLNDDPGYLRLKIRELEEENSKLKAEHSDMQNRLEQSKQILEHTEKTLNQESNNWYIKYKEVNTKLGALQDVLNGIRIMIGG